MRAPRIFRSPSPAPGAPGVANDGLADEALMARYADGDHQAFNVLYGRHRAPLYRFLLRHGLPPARAEELFQECWSRVIQARERYRPEGARFGTWLFQIGHNLCLDELRRAEHRYWQDGDAIDVLEADQHSQADLVDLQQQAAHLHRAIADLPAGQREALLLREEGGMSLEEIAHTTGVPRETAKTRLRYAIDKLRKVLNP